MNFLKRKPNPVGKGGKTVATFPAHCHMLCFDNINMTLRCTEMVEFYADLALITPASCGMLGSITFTNMNETSSLKVICLSGYSDIFPLRVSGRDVMPFQ